MMYTRGQFAMMGNVGRKALRIYHEEGLLVPVCVNEENGYHYYDEAQLVTLEKIKRLRKIGLSLFEIKQILDGKASENAIIESKTAETDTLLKEMKELTTLNNDKKGSIQDIKPDIKSFERCMCLYVDENVEKENLGMSVGKLYEKASKEGIAIAGNHFVKYEGLVEDEAFSTKTCLPVSKYEGNDATEVYEPNCLHLHFTGGFSKVWQAHEKIRQYADNCRIALADRVYEVYNKDMSVDVYYSMAAEK